MLTLAACKDSKSPAVASQPKSGHERMVAILDSIARNASFQDCYNLNSQKAAYFFNQLQQAPPAQQPTMKFLYADQLLNAGQNEMAIMQLTELTQLYRDELNANTKPIYEYLALAYMRLGEQDNCINTHTAESCILPIQNGGVYKLPSGPTNAIRIYERLLAQFPDDVQSKWLLNIAYMTLGRWPDGVPAKHRLPEKIFQNRGNIRFKDVAIPLGLDVRGISGGVCMEDFDGDNLLDLFVTSYGLRDQARFFHNNGDGTYADRTSAANLTGIVSGLNTLQADYDNDGDRDVLILRGAWLVGGTHPNSLLRNNGDGTFTDVTIEAGLLSFHPTQAADWADFDGDGWLDLYVSNETLSAQKPHPNELYHNNGDGTFTNVAPDLGVDLVAFFKAAVWGDINNDQRPDLYLSVQNGPNVLLVNRGGTSMQDWKFENKAEAAGVTEPVYSFPAFFFDYDNDGYDDIYATNYRIEPKDPTAADAISVLLGAPLDPALGPRLYHNNHNETFTDVHQEAGLHNLSYPMGHNYGDLDNDGWNDVYFGTGKPDLRALVPNRMFRNVDGKKFEDLTMNGFGQIQKGHGVAFGDLDNDGDQDIYMVVGGAFEGDQANNVLFLNPGQPDRHFVTLFLEGKTCNRDALGAKIAVHTVQPGGKKRIIRATVDTGGSFGAGSLRQEIGLDRAESIEKIEVQWPKPGLAPGLYEHVPVDACVKLTEGQPAFEVLSLPKLKMPG
jgi:tetratricopeptide (TPR) repeat protein